MSPNAPRSPGETREIVTCRFLPALLKRLDAEAARDNRSRSTLIQMAVEEFLDRREGKRKKG